MEENHPKGCVRTKLMTALYLQYNAASKQVCSQCDNTLPMPGKNVLVILAGM